LFSLIFFFFQAEDGIRDRNVTGVQTCALPIYPLKTRRSALVREDRSLSENSSRPRLMARSIRSFRPLGGHSNSSNIASLRYTIPFHSVKTAHHQTMHKKVICLMGPTASGKTSTALFLADHLPLHIISVDSALIYKGMDIGTAKPDKTTLERYPHALVDIINPLERYSAAQFRLDATREIEYAFSEGKIPLLVGGTFLYFQ